MMTEVAQALTRIDRRSLERLPRLLGDIAAALMGESDLAAAVDAIAGEVVALPDDYRKLGEYLTAADVRGLPVDGRMTEIVAMSIGNGVLGDLATSDVP